MRSSICLALLCLLCEVSEAQKRPMREAQGTAFTPSGVEASVSPPLGALKRPGHYTAKDWQALIDSAWGPGLPTATKLTVFDTFWNSVDQTWGGFPNISINWDSLKNVYRPMVAAGVSRGRFAAILTRLVRELNEWHVGILDLGIDGTMNYYPDLVSWSEYPNYSSFRYRAGVPVINLNILFWRTNFGAGLTPVNDSTLVVYSVIPNHPLALQPGDIVLGYDRKPWAKQIKELFDAELPFLSSDLTGIWLGSTPAASHHATMISAGMNWGLFDSIDVVKYSTKDTLHYPTSLLAGILPPYHIATEQLPVSGVPFPDLQGNKLVSWGVVQGTKIGYIYGWDWCGRPQGETRQLFGRAVDELMHTSNVEGLILDFRTNPGGWPEYANEGFKHLFNVDPTSNYGSAYRVPGGGHLDFAIYPPLNVDFFTPTTEIFDHPIAVLTGPLSGSSGDYNAFRLRFHPMVRFFGKPTAGAYTDLSAQAQHGFIAGTFYYRVDNGSVYSHHNNEGLMIHKTFPVDEEVWLTREGIVKGEDDVVRRALEWINTLSYAHDVTLNPTYARPGVDSVRVTSTLANPLHHAVTLSAIVTDAGGALVDSIILYNDGLHGDESAGDSVWGRRLRAPSGEGFFDISFRTDDITGGTSRRMPNVGRFATVGPVTLDSVAFGRSGLNYGVRVYLRNKSSSFILQGATVSIRSNDAWVNAVTQGSYALPTIGPGEMSTPASFFSIAYDTAAFPGYFNVIVDVALGGWVLWTDSTRLRVTGVEAEKTLPLAYTLEQNYPNPFNGISNFGFAISDLSWVKLAVYDLLGREVEVLVNERKAPGRYAVSWDASGFPSGVYICRMKAGDFAASRRMVLMK